MDDNSLEVWLYMATPWVLLNSKSPPRYIKSLSMRIVFTFPLEMEGISARLCESVGMICVTWLLVMLKMTGLITSWLLSLVKLPFNTTVSLDNE